MSAANSGGARAKLGSSWLRDPDKPWFHVMPRDGWLNDPNGPIFYKGRYHMCALHPSYPIRCTECPLLLLTLLLECPSSLPAPTSILWSPCSGARRRSKRTSCNKR